MALQFNHDDEFDWEAAVAEIDVACRRVALDGPFLTSANCIDIDCSQVSLDRTLKQSIKGNTGILPQKPSKAVRQSTLDKFVEITEKHTDDQRSYYENRTSNCENSDALFTIEGIKSDIDPAAAKTWIYPINVPLRDYQFSIVKTALFSNTLVSLPTGLGKTLIAAVVMYNYFRWFPTGKIVFAAPSRPLVMQQIEACHNIVGIPQEWTIDMTGQMSPAQRSGFWQSKRIFFVTPQVLEKDIQSGACLTNKLVCLVIDEAHRAMGNYSYCVVVREIMAMPVQLRILALTATPGTKQATIQTVIDNLHISTMEYRNENDPDVSQYTHNRKLELIQVAINKESLKVSSLLLDVIQPIVQRLCNLGVFYNKDIARLTPFEFLTARERFRQAPPSTLAQMQYGEVEGYFGAAITLYHIYKLLFSHGVRPAFEMLQQKMQQGSFARLMGRNETMWQVKLLMQQTLGHGAPNPKLLKMEEIIIKHFESTDHKNSRVIIFTNFRESVKDIMESLAKLGDAIKAMEFIGQTSGKASKGQSQKVQQAVLKKFRAGGYNIIVATSIGEEGLDIMEVDLVICFDANISPLRMIQRMGRTGRKRDGRVVILASEGSELQGYLKKQAKGRAVGKHMHNGGINSFNFHSSPRMVPHSFQPEVQFVEMSIEKFVPRGRKPKVDAASADLGADDLTDCEKNLLGKYFGLCTDKNWKPSLIAFPHYQLFPSPVYKVKHSFRTTEMLIDTLQCLQEPRISLMGSKTCSLIKEVEGSSTYCMPALLDITKETTPQGISTKAGGSGPPDLVPEQHDSEPCSPSTPLDEAIPDSPKYSGEINAFSTGFSNQVDAFAKHKSPFNEELLEKNSDADIHYQETEPVSGSSRISLHRCLFNTGFVSVGPDGKVIISAAPTLPLLNEPSSDANFMIRNHSAELFSEGPVLPSLKIDYPEKAEVSMPRSDPVKMTLSPEVIKVSTSPSGLMEVMFSPKQVKVSTPPSSLTRLAVSPGQVKDIFCGADEPEVQTPISSSRLFGKPEDVVPATPDSCFVNFPSDVPENVSPHTSNAGASYIDFSPRLRNLAERGIVPESPIATVTKCAIAEREPKNQYASNLMANGTRSHQKSPAFGIVASSWEEPHTYLREKGIADVANTNTEICKTPRENGFTAPADVSQEVLKENNMKLKDSSPFSEAGPQNLAARRSLQDDAKKLNFEFLSVPKSLAVKATSTPANNLSSKSCSEDWQLSSAEAAKSVQKARKFKRLCKYKDRAKGKFSATPTEIPSKSKTKLDNLSVGICRKSRLLKGRQYSKVSVHPFIDEEAEVSSDEQLSTDEDDDNEDAGDEGESESDSFIDDRIEPTAAPTQAEGHHVDMMAIYRKSLLTQSPLDDELNPWDHFHRSHISPGCTGNESSAASEETFVSEDSLVGTDSRSLAASPRPSAVHDSPIKTSSSGCLGINDVVKDSEIVDLNAGSSEERNSKIESRKRKLSFHQVNAPANLKLLQNQVSSLLGGNLKERLNESCNQNQHIDGTFDDGLFEGLDLDALEAEAAEMVRARPNITLCMQQTIPIVPSCLPYTHTLDMGSSVKPFLNNTTSIQQPTRMPLAEAFDVQNCINDKDNSNDCSTAGGVKEKNQETGIDVDLDFLCTPSFDLGI